MRKTGLLALLAVLAGLPAMAQTPVPFPRPGQPTTPPATPPPPAQQPPATPQQAPATLGVAIYPGAQFVASYDAGMGQRYYLFGTAADFTQIVGYYRNILKSRGELVFEQPPVHMFDVGRFREQTMAFPPSVTVKDYTWGGSQGYLNPKAGAEPARFRTIIQIVPPPPGAPGR